ncbi:DUF6789 family protein [Natronolimnohabitans innermongolicus]|uniref:Histidine kinase n=1 Tax=Natronolimnohabitans innermongolicus JCM 12255 TaxID=1227499 RepID=L9XAL3_9EURY|nr:hypothetical protein [Natronolimnohabitans innermongolicus]ELY58760.1 hypothetical protein C493_06317 [Natronolimnohabitans innermongolicus JCM 12255]
MSVQVDSPITFGIGGSFNWLVGGAVGGAVGSLLFGLVLWLADPAIITEAVPAIYGLEPVGTAGWLFHLGHGLVLGAVFGYLVTRSPVFGTLMADVETDFIAAMGPGTRLVLAGFVYGLAVWAILPVIVLTLWTAVGPGEAAFPGLAFESLVGHLLYGLLLGALFALVAQLERDVEQAEAPFEEAGESR